MFAQEPPPDFDISCRREPGELPEPVAEMVSYMRLLKESVLRIWKARKAAVREELDRAKRAAKAIQEKLDRRDEPRRNRVRRKRLCWNARNGTGLQLLAGNPERK